MKALFISNDPLVFDTGSAVRARMQAYADAIGELHILSRAPLGARASSDKNLFLYPVHGPKIFTIGILARRANALIRERGIEVVSAQDPFEHGLAALRAVRGTAAKLHIQIHTDFLSPWFVRSGNWRSPRVRMPLLNRFRISIADKVLPRADGVRVVSKRITDSLQARYGSRIKEPTIIPIALSGEVPAKAELPERFNFTLFAASRLEPEKRIEDILAALALITNKYPMVGLVLAGEGSERRRLERMARSLGLAAKVRFLGWRSDVGGLMQSANAFIQASAYEGYGATLVEAALARVPIITTDVGIVGEVFRGYEEVLSVPVADPTALSYAIIGLVEDMAVRSELPRAAEAAARAHLLAVGDIPARVAADIISTNNTSCL